MGTFQKWLDSFKQADTGVGKEPSFGGEPSDISGEKKQPLGKDEFANTTVAVKTEDGGIIAVPEETSLKRSLKGRHIQFIALGGSIGTGLFVGSGSNLSTGGPGSIIVAYLIVAVMIIPVIFALGELAAVLPVTGAFSTYATRFIDPSWGFAMGWNYFLQWYVTFPLEATAATILINFWDQDEKVPKAVWIIIFWLIIAFINLFGVRGYGEFEFIATSIKVLGILGFIICAIVVDCGGSPSGTYLGARGWHTTDAFLYGFKGFCSVFITAAFAFSGTELVGLAAAETSNPRKEIPKACKQVLLRVLLFYILSLFLITLIVPADDPRLQGSSNDARASPFVIVIQMGQIHALPQIFNAIILLSALSVGNASVYGGSRTLLSLAEQGMAPKFFRYVDRAGRPLPSVLFCLAFGFLGFLIYGSSSNTVFTWLLSISGLSAIFAWISTCWAHIRFRAAWTRQGNSLKMLPWISPLGLWGSWIGLILNILVIAASFYGSAWPIDEGTMNPSDRASTFFENMLSLPIVLFFFIAHKIWTRSRFVRIDEIDVQTGRRDPISEEVLEQERAERRALPLWKRCLTALF